MKRSAYILILLGCVVAILGLRCGDTGTGPEPPSYGLSPDSTDVEVSSSRQFTLTSETEPLSVVWYVDGTRGGSPETGMITPNGLFIAPHSVPDGGYVTITAEAKSDTTYRESAKAVIMSGYGAVSVQVSPESTAVALGDSVTFLPASSGCPLAMPEWSFVGISPGPGQLGTMRPNGTYVAPSSAFEDFMLMAMVASADCPDKMGIAKIRIVVPEPFKVELEGYTESSGGGIMNTVLCDGGQAVIGLDAPGEWIEVPYEVKVGGTYTAEIHYGAIEGDILRVSVTEAVCDTSSAPQPVDFVMPGAGLT